MDLLRTATEQWGNAEGGVALFNAVLRGEVENPNKPKATVKFMGATIETGGVEQAAWDEMMSLCDKLVRLTDEKHVRALLIATCGVQTRKDLTKDNAALFIEALKLNIADEESKRASEPEEEIPF